MKKLLALICLSTLFLSGCFEVIQETTINNDESGSYKHTTDLSMIVGMAKMMGGGEDLKKLGEAKDTTIALTKLADSIQGLTEKERAFVRTGFLNFIMNVQDEKLMLTFIFPYTDPKDVSNMAVLLKKIRKEVIGAQMDALEEKGEGTRKMGEGVSETPEIDEFFDVVQTKGRLTRTLNKDRYAKVGEDEGLKSMQEMSQMGSPMTLKTILNLPRPATKIEAKGAEISADKKKITITATIDDLFEKPSKFEYVIEY